MLVVHFMRPANGADVGIVAAGKPLKTLVNDNLVHYKIGEAIQGNAKPNGRRNIVLVLQTEHNTQPAWYRKYQKESVVLFEKSRIGLVMILMQIP